MKVLILTVSAGEGHNSMSRAISNYLKETYKDVVIKQIDLFKDGPMTIKKKQAGWMVNDGYFTLVKYFIKFANSQFERLKRRDYSKDAVTLRSTFIKPARPYVEEVINEFKPDAIFCAHTFAGIILTDLRKEGNPNALNARVVTVVSDFDVAPYTELLTEVDYIITPTDDFDDDLTKRGFDLKKRLSLGIPIQSKFGVFIDQKEARRMLGIDENKDTVMLMSGGVGFGRNGCSGRGGAARGNGGRGVGGGRGRGFAHVSVIPQKDKTNVKSAQYLYTHIKDAKLILLESTGHAVNEEQPKQLAQILQEFLMNSDNIKNI